MPLFLHLFLFLYNRYIHTSLIHSLTFAEAHLYCCWLLCRSQDGVGGVMDVGEEPTAVAVPPAPVPGAAPATRPPASTGQCGS
jgi:hypothetical protein